MAVDLSFSGTTVQTGTPRAIADNLIGGFDVAPDGTVLAALAAQTSAPIHVITNWPALLRKVTE